MRKSILSMRWCAIALCLASAIPSAEANSSIRISGQVKAGNSQTFYAPQSDTWRVQVQWMLPEGDIAKPGDVVLVFEGGSIAATIEQDEVSLANALDELKRVENQGAQSVLEAEFALKKAELQLAKAKIDASVPKQHLSSYDYEENQLKLEQAVIQKHKALASLKETQTVADVNLNKQKIEIERLKITLAENKDKLAALTLKATNQGPIIYANHPWNGSKLFSGVTAQPGWKIAEVPSMTGLYLEAWIHEIDYKHFKENQKVSLTLDAYQKSPLQATLTNLSTQPEERQQWGKDAYFRAQFEFNADALKVLPGMTGRIEIQGSNHEQG